jgi:hypothetical protein
MATNPARHAIIEITGLNNHWRLEIAMLTIKCPGCGTEGRISFVDPDYEGPYKCWKCHGSFSIKVRAGELESCQPISDEDMQKMQEIEDMKARYRRPSE